MMKIIKQLVLVILLGLSLTFTGVANTQDYYLQGGKPPEKPKEKEKEKDKPKSDNRGGEKPRDEKKDKKKPD